MCTHQRTIFNPYTHTSHFVPCGKCKACRQQKAYKRAYRIKCEQSPDKIGLFVTLTYDRYSCPYVLQLDIDKRVDILPVYRDIRTRRVRNNTKDGIKFLDKRINVTHKLNDIYFPNYESFDKRSNIRHLAYLKDKIGVCYYPDLQLFKKRLNINLKRIYNYEQSYKVYSCSEYGETTSRPHFHLLFFIRPSDEALFRAAISQAWPFASHRRTERFIEIAKDCSNYVASYINSGSFVHGFLSDNFKTKHSYSKDFGMSNKLFSFDSILEKIDRRDFSFLRGIGPKGLESYVNFCIPKYVINRYFPLFKGFSRFTDTEVLDVLQCFIQPGTRKASTPLIDLSHLQAIDYTKDDLHKIVVRLTNSYDKYCKYVHDKGFVDFNCDPSIEDYCLLYRDAWRIYKNTQLKLWYADDTVDPKYKYDNTQQLKGGLIYSPDSLSYLDSTPAVYIDNPNEYPQVKKMTYEYERIFDFRCKERKINNFVMAQNSYYF